MLIDDFVPYEPADGSDYSEHYRGFTTRLVVSQSNGHMRFDPPPPDEVLQEYYNGSFSDGGNETYNEEYQFRAELVDVARGVLGFYTGKTGLPATPAVHDHGCAFGGLVYGFQENGLAATGNEPNQEWVEVGNRYCRGALTAAPLERALEAIEYDVDLFTSCHVFEHLSDPLSDLRAMRRKLSPEGIAYINVPNVDSAQWKIGLRRVPNIYAFPMHLQYFTPKSMFAHVREAGLEPFLVETRWMDGHAPDEYVFDTLLGLEHRSLLAVEPFKRALCENLLGGELFVVAGHPENSTFARTPDIDDAAERARGLSRALDERAAGCAGG